MGSKKTKLERANRFGLLKAAELAAEMIGDYERARRGTYELRVESLESAIWDDVVVRNSQRTEKWQVKRLMSEFDSEDAAAVLDSAARSTDGSHLCVGVASFVSINDGKTVVCEMRRLAELCEEARKDGLVAPDFAKAHKSNSAFMFVKRSVTPSTDDIALSTLRRLTFTELGIEAKLHASAKHHLVDIFSNSDEVVRQLHSWFLNNNDGAILVSIDLLYSKIIGPYAKRDPSRPRWIHLRRDPATLQWESRGPLSVDELVEHAWGPSPVRVQLGVAPFAGESSTASISRLILHRTPNTAPEARPADAAQWAARAADICGGTLGNSAERVSISCEDLAIEPTCPPRTLRSDLDFSRLASEKMSELVWNDLLLTVGQRLFGSLIAEDLRGPMKALWGQWVSQLASPTERDIFLRSMLATAEEWKRAGFDTAVRSGRAIVEALARTIIIALAASVALCPTVSAVLGLSGSVVNLTLDSTNVHVIALAAASHPLERIPFSVSDAPGALFSAEPALTILGLVEASASDLYRVACAENVPFHETDVASQNYRHAGLPFPLITASPVFRAAMKSGFADLRKHLLDILRQMLSDRMNPVEVVMQEVAP